ncbi:2,3-bisphosphoglycerate-independent phosphoglycerate mutase [Candidatus Berkelbacteria bacterium CG06_land_8_20_14_3_00_43_10]|nr:MAG: 2,3-bisphosphoglycerate-independent phosphoglycerate mutase [Candidatus Berkelbacteria bacterium CG06_land_8_20_14_3_00_43_10]
MDTSLTQPSAVLIILDGWGLRPDSADNAILSAKTPTMDTLASKASYISLQASGESVGLPWGEMGNSEVGHITIGSGRVVLADYTQISQSIQTGTFKNNPVLRDITDYVKKASSSLHIIGLLSNAGVHGHMDHILATVSYAASQGFDPCIHLITDGRDSPPQSALTFIKEFNEKLTKIGKGKIVTVCGRYFAMDRDKRWDRTLLAYQAIAHGIGKKAQTIEEAIQANYDSGKFDEFIEPTIIGEPSPMKENDGIICTNFRSDRALQITKMFLSKDIEGVEHDCIPNIYFASMTEYEHGLGTHPLFSVVNLNNPQSNPLTHPLGEVVSEAGLVQLHVAETEKYAHVTYFFNAGREEPFNKEVRIVVPSLKVATYDSAPQMSAEKITHKFIEAWKKDTPAFSVINYANADMVGHTGDLPATIQGVETIDAELKKIIDTIRGESTHILITADHGNAEQLKNPENHMIDKEHSTYPVPFIYIRPEYTFTKWVSLPDDQRIALAALEPAGLLADIAPTVIEILGLQQPVEMTGQSLCGIMTT